MYKRQGLAAGQQVVNRAVALCVPDLGVALVLTFHKIEIVALVELPFYLREGRSQIIRVLWGESRAEAVKAVPIDVTLCSFRVDVFTVGKVETPVVVLGVVSAVGSGSSVVSCQFQIEMSIRDSITLRYNGGRGPYKSTEIRVGTEMIDQWKIILSLIHIFCG